MQFRSFKSLKESTTLLRSYNNEDEVSYPMYSEPTPNIGNIDNKKKQPTCRIRSKSRRRGKNFRYNPLTKPCVLTALRLPFGMIIISIIQLVLFWSGARIEVDPENGGIIIDNYSLAANLVFNPDRKAQVWRFITYIFVHEGWRHLIANIILQTLSAWPLENNLKQTLWISIIYICGVLLASISHSIINPSLFLLGASGGTCATVATLVAHVLLNWRYLSCYRVLGYLALPTISIIYMLVTACRIDGYQVSSHVVHGAGALSGILVGAGLLETIKDENGLWRKILRFGFPGLYGLLLLIGIVWTSVASSMSLPKQEL